MRGQYIKTLQRSERAKNSAIITAQQGLHDLVVLCSSDKFKENEYIHVKDVMLFCSQLKDAIRDKENDILMEPLPETKSKEIVES